MPENLSFHIFGWEFGYHIEPFTEAKLRRNHQKDQAEANLLHWNAVTSSGSSTERDIKTFMEACTAWNRLESATIARRRHIVIAGRIKELSHDESCHY